MFLALDSSHAASIKLSAMLTLPHVSARCQNKVEAESLGTERNKHLSCFLEQKKQIWKYVSRQIVIHCQFDDEDAPPGTTRGMRVVCRFFKIFILPLTCFTGLSR